MKAACTAKWFIVFWLLTGCTVAPRTYRIAVLSIPLKLDPVNMVTISSSLVYANLYYPLFSRNEYGALESRFLEMQQTRALSEKFDEFRFCLKEGLTFSDGSPISVNDLKLTLTRLPTVRRNMASIKFLTEESNSCLRFRLSQPDSTLFDKCLTERSTVLKESTVKSDAPIGLGPYRIKAKSDKRILLEEVPGRVQGDFKNVELIVVDTSRLTEINEPIDDWNNLGPISLPPSLVAKGFRTIEKRLPKVYYVHVGLDSDLVRSRLSQCFDKKRFISALELPLEPIDGLIPKGVLGSEVKRSITRRDVAPDCHFAGDKQKLRFFSFNPALHEKIVDFFKLENSKLPVEVVVESHTLTETNHAYYHHETFMTLYGLIADEPLPEAFLSDLVRPEWSYKPVGRLEAILNTSRREENLAKKQVLLTQAHQEVLNSGFVIPLGQVRATLFYPTHIRNIRSLYDFYVFPQVDRMYVSRWYEGWLE